MKAIFEFDAPKSCHYCILRFRVDAFEHICLADKEQQQVPAYANERSAFCPLKIVPKLNAKESGESE